ncbi:esterase/lipase family protein [Nocardia arthritidis]|uniref:AB hydrolase-1 domain-containing protein n=1 Tax=Nocardia arthritidis TaxID=228602 RepID=A0A6G9YE67_9NOCA|nr:alpha/beta hydrolase [Nocardia arthritidis]QIS11521.1 hypothetical protein F5544_18235 [Nocardia arthritidis]
MGDMTLVLVHGFFSNERTWDRFADVLGADQEFGKSLVVKRFGYTTPVLRVSPLRRIPDLGDIASSLRGWLRDEAARGPVLIVSHSMGGLVTQRFLADRLRAGRLDELANIAGVVMFACPNQGSEIFGALRRSMPWWRHPQERQLRPLNAEVTEAQQVVIERVVHSATAKVPGVPIPIWAFAGDSDRVVRSRSATFVFDDERSFTLPGDHSSIIRPDSAAHRSYAALRRAVNEAAQLFTERETAKSSTGTGAIPASGANAAAPKGIGATQSITNSTIGADAVQLADIHGDVDVVRAPSAPPPAGTLPDRRGSVPPPPTGSQSVHESWIGGSVYQVDGVGGDVTLE